MEVYHSSRGKRDQCRDEQRGQQPAFWGGEEIGHLPIDRQCGA